MELIRRIFRKVNAKIVNARRKIKLKEKINLGECYVPFGNAWFSCDIDTLNITKDEDWVRLFEKQKVSYLFAEHAWSLLSDEGTLFANSNCYKFSQPSHRYEKLI